MSVFSPLDVEEPFDRKRAIIQQILQQLQANAQRASGPGLGGAVGALLGAVAGGGFAPSHQRGGPALTTHQVPNLPAALVRLLGPGGIGHAIPGLEMSGGPGRGLMSHLGSAPHAGVPANTPHNVGQGTIPTQPQPQGGTIGSSYAQLVSGGQTNADLPPDLQLSGVSPNAPVIGGSKQVMPPQPVQGPSRLVPLGNGLAFDPTSGVIVNSRTGGAGGGGGVHYAL